MVGNVSLVDLICMCSSLFPDSPEFVREKVVHKNPVDVMEGKAVRLGDVLELFDESRAITFYSLTFCF